jgi:hypothetical protein
MTGNNTLQSLDARLSMVSMRYNVAAFVAAEPHVTGAAGVGIARGEPVWDELLGIHPMPPPEAGPAAPQLEAVLLKFGGATVFAPNSPKGSKPSFQRGALHFGHVSLVHVPGFAVRAAAFLAPILTRLSGQQAAAAPCPPESPTPRGQPPPQPAPSEADEAEGAADSAGDAPAPNATASQERDGGGWPAAVLSTNELQFEFHLAVLHLAALSHPGRGASAMVLTIAALQVS